MSTPTYLRTPTVPLDRAWNTWAADRYVEMTFKPLGFRLTPLAFSAKAGKTVLFGPGDDVRLFEHAVDGSTVAARLNHAGTTLHWRYEKPSPFVLRGGWHSEATGEWGLRFWICLALSLDDGGDVHYDPAQHVAWATVGPRTVAIAAQRPALLVTGHPNIAALAGEYEDKGYWYLGSRATCAPLIALRFNLEEAAENRFAAAIADRRDLAVAAALAARDAPLAVRPPQDGPVAAVRDVMGWNSIWDAVNHRPYITCSRNWDLKKFGGFGFWLNDTAINALLVSLFDAEQARESIATLLSGATPQGNLPCILTGNDQWVDRTQSPIVSFIVWQLWQRTGNRALLASAFATLRANNDWLFEARDGNRNGVLEFGSSDVGNGLYLGTRLAAKDESFMDNSPIHDEANWNAQTRTLDCEDVGLNCLACLDAEMLAKIAAELSYTEESSRLAGRARLMRERISAELWDDSRKIFANRLWSGEFVRSVAPTSFYPLLCGAASEAQKAHLLAHLEDPAMFGGAFGLPSVARSDPALADNVYWRGRIWPILNFLVWSGLKRSGEHEAATRLARRGEKLFRQSWAERRLCPENYNPETGEGLDQADTDPFYSWSALLPYITIAEVIDVSPWDGFTVTAAGDDAALAPTLTPAGSLSASRYGNVLRLNRGSDTVLETTVPRLTHLATGPDVWACTVPTGLRGVVRFAVPQGRSVVACRVNAREVSAAIHGGLVSISIDEPAPIPQRLTVLILPDRREGP